MIPISYDEDQYKPAQHVKITVDASKEFERIHGYRPLFGDSQVSEHTWVEVPEGCSVDFDGSTLTIGSAVYYNVLKVDCDADSYWTHI